MWKQYGMIWLLLSWEHLAQNNFESEVWVARLCLTLWAWTVACQAPLSMGSSRQEYWSGHALLQGIFPTLLSCIAGEFFTTWATRETQNNFGCFQISNCCSGQRRDSKNSPSPPRMNVQSCRHVLTCAITWVSSRVWCTSPPVCSLYECWLVCAPLTARYRE